MAFPTKTVISATLVVILAGGGYAAATRPKSATTISAYRQTVVESVVASGRMIAPSVVTLGSLQPGVVAAVMAEEGQTVKAGDVLVKLDDKNEKAAVLQAKASVSQAKAQLRQIAESQRAHADVSLTAAKAEVLRAQSVLDRVKKLHASNTSTTAELEDAEMNLTLAKAKENAAAIDLAATQNKGAAMSVAKAQLEAAEASLAAAQARLEQARVVAPSDGVILERHVELGDAVTLGKTLLLLRTDKKTEIVIEPDEKNLANIKIGQEAKAVADAFPKNPFAAKIKYIAPSIDASRGTVKVRLDVENPPEFLRTDMTVSVELKTGTKENVLVLPIDAVRDVATKSPYVLIYDATSQTANKTDIKIGAKGTDVVEILDGIKDGVMVITDPKISSGNKVTPVNTANNNANNNKNNDVNNDVNNNVNNNQKTGAL